MNMKQLNKFLLMVLLSATPPLVFAVDGVVHVTGYIVDASCDVNVNGDGGSTTINLGNISAKSFSGVGAKSTPKLLTIKLTDCSNITTDSDKAHVYFGGIADDTNPNLLKATSNDADVQAATGVGIGIYNTAGTLIGLGPSSPIPLSISDGEGTFIFYVNYESTVTNTSPSLITSGPANATTTFNIDYQ